MSFRRACRNLHVEPSSYHYMSRRPSQASFKQRITEIAEMRVRYGYRRIHVLLLREGWLVNSSAVAESLNSSWFPSLRLAATDLFADICRELTAWKPQLLITYGAISGVLAEERLAGRLDIAPSAVMCVAETLISATRAKVREAWDAEPFENYASTEAACVAAECRRRTGLHLFDDFLVTEVVDESNWPVPPGTMGEKVLVSVLLPKRPRREDVNRDRVLVRGALRFRRHYRISWHQETVPSGKRSQGWHSTT